MKSNVVANSGPASFACISCGSKTWAGVVCARVSFFYRWFFGCLPTNHAHLKCEKCGHTLVVRP